MKRFNLIIALAVIALGFLACNKDGDDYEVFIGTWGVERIDYYNTDFNGNPIQNTIETYTFTPGDPHDGIDLIFNKDRSGEMRDRSRDTLFINNDTILCPDTTIVTRFTYSYHKDDATLYMNMQVAHPYTFQLNIVSINDNKFVYVNEYDNNYVEKAQLVRIGSKDTRGETSGNRTLKSVTRPRRKGSLLSDY
jgi:hypothetical protein